MDFDEKISELAARQHGVLCRVQARDLGLSRHHIEDRLSAGRWRRVHEEVYAIGGAPPTRYQLAMAACLAAGPVALASHRTAAWLWGFDGFDSAPIEVSVANGRGPVPRDVVVHSTKRFDPVDRTVQAGIPVTTRERTILDLGAVAPPKLVELALESYLRRGGSLGRLVPRLDAVGGRGCRGVGVARALLTERRPGATAASPLEVRFTRLLRDAGVRLPVRQYAIPIGGGELYVVDAAYPPPDFVAVELQSEEFHSSARAVRRDRERFNRLTRLGWRALEFTAADLDGRPEYVIGTLSALIPDLFGQRPA